MKRSNEITRRSLLERSGLLAAGALFPKWARAEATAVGRREILKGLDGMSRAADPGSPSFVNGHMAAAVISSAFFCREEKLDDDTRKELLSLVEKRLLS